MLEQRGWNTDWHALGAWNQNWEIWLHECGINWNTIKIFLLEDMNQTDQYQEAGTLTDLWENIGTKTDLALRLEHRHKHCSQIACHFEFWNSTEIEEVHVHFINVQPSHIDPCSMFMANNSPLTIWSIRYIDAVSFSHSWFLQYQSSLLSPIIHPVLWKAGLHQPNLHPHVPQQLS